MSHFLLSVLGFLLAVGLLVTVHEWGHYWVARRLNVKVLQFAIGFGPVIRAWRRGETEYALRAVPLGGFVKMLDHREGEVDPAEADRAFDRQSVGRRAAIVFAGPLANIVFAILAYTLMFMFGVQGLTPILGTPVAGTPAALAGLQNGDEIVSVNGQGVRSFEALRVAVLQAVARDQDVHLEVRADALSALHAGQAATRWVTLADTRALLAKPVDPLLQLGLRPWQPEQGKLMVRKVSRGSAAEQAGMLVGDQIVGVGGIPLQQADAFFQEIRNHPGRSLQIEVERDGRTLSLHVIPAIKQQGGVSIGFLGAGFGWDIPEDIRQRLLTVERLDPWQASQAAVTKTWDMTVLSLQVMGKMLTGQASLESISGPLGIADIAGRTLVLGISTFLGFLALVSLSLAILNLLPIPVLDGGHLLFYLIEALRGRPLSERAQMLGQKIGLSMLLALMVLAMFNDITRLLT